MIGIGRKRTERRPRRRLLGVIAVVTLALVGTACARPRVSSAPASCGPSSPPDAVSARLLQRTNSDRAANGLGPLAWHGQLWCLGDSWAEHMAATNTFAHQNLATALSQPQYAGFNTLGENILRAPVGITADGMQDAWLASPSHRANIMSNAYRWFATGVAFSADGKIYVAAEFGG